MEDINMVEETLTESAFDDQTQAPDTDALSEILAADEPTAEDESQQTEQQGQEESKALRGRMKHYENRGYERGKREAESAWAEEKRGYEERLAKYAERDLEDEAKALAAEKHIPFDFALEHVRMKNGMPAQKQEAAAHVEETGTANAAASQRANILMAQAEAYEKYTDGSVTKEQILEAFQNDPEIRERVRSGEMDFTDVGKQIASGGKKPPHVPRTPNEGNVGRRSFATMSDASFDEINRRVMHGAVFDSRR